MFAKFYISLLSVFTLNINEFYTRQYDEIKRAKQKECLMF
jgi:hypothetical protein